MFRHPRSCVTDSTDCFAFFNGFSDYRHDFVSDGRAPAEATNQHQRSIIVGHRIKRIIGHCAEAAD
jgi:hypothetical protein